MPLVREVVLSCPILKQASGIQIMDGHNIALNIHVRKEQEDLSSMAWVSSSVSCSDCEC